MSEYTFATGTAVDHAEHIWEAPVEDDNETEED